MAALEQVVQDVEPAIYVFKDFHSFMRPDNIGIVRHLREVATYLKDTYKTLVIVSPFLQIAPELQKDVTVIDFPLPDVEDLRELMHRIIAEVGEQSNIKVELDSATEDRLLHAALGLTLKEAENVLAKTLVIDGTLSGEDVSVVFSEKQQIIRKSGLLEYYESMETLGDVGGMDALKEWLERRKLAFGEKAKAFGLPAPKGILLLGVQGCGKSLCAKAVSKAWELPLLRFDVGKMFGSLVGSSEENIRRAIAIAESVSPAILWVDEIDKAFAGTASSGQTRRRHDEPRVRDVPDLAVREDRAGICHRDGKRHLRSAAGAAAQGPPRRDILRGPAQRGGAQGHPQDPYSQARP